MLYFEDLDYLSHEKGMGFPTVTVICSGANSLYSDICSAEFSETI